MSWSNFIVRLMVFLYLLKMYGLVFNIRVLVRVFLIVSKSFLSLCIVYLVMGFSWYLLLFGLVYVGGVFVLFVYISFIVPNVGLVKYRFRYLSGGFRILVLFLMGVSSYVVGGSCVMDCSVYLCSTTECQLYLFYCFVLLLGLVLINSLVSGLSSYIR